MQLGSPPSHPSPRQVAYATTPGSPTTQQMHFQMQLPVPNGSGHINNAYSPLGYNPNTHSGIGTQFSSQSGHHTQQHKSWTQPLHDEDKISSMHFEQGSPFGGTNGNNGINGINMSGTGSSGGSGGASWFPPVTTTSQQPSPTYSNHLGGFQGQGNASSHGGQVATHNQPQHPQQQYNHYQHTNASGYSPAGHGVSQGTIGNSGYNSNPQTHLQDTSSANHISALETENTNLRAQLSTHRSDNNRLTNECTDLRLRLESTRGALRDSRDSLQKVQGALQPLMRNQQSRDEQHQQLLHINRVYEAKIREYEQKFQLAELSLKKQTSVAQRAEETCAEDTALIDKLHARLLGSQAALVKCQSDMQRAVVDKAAMAASYAENQNKVQALEVQLLMQAQTSLQAEAARKNEEDARLRLVHIDLTAARERISILESTLQNERGIRDEQRKSDENQRENAFNAELATAMSTMESLEKQRTMADKLAILKDAEKGSLSPNAMLLNWQLQQANEADENQQKQGEIGLASPSSPSSGTTVTGILDTGRALQMERQKSQQLDLERSLSDAVHISKVHGLTLSHEMKQEMDKNQENSESHLHAVNLAVQEGESRVRVLLGTDALTASVEVGSSQDANSAGHSNTEEEGKESEESEDPNVARKRRAMMLQQARDAKKVENDAMQQEKKRLEWESKTQAQHDTEEAQHVALIQAQQQQKALTYALTEAQEDQLAAHNMAKSHESASIEADKARVAAEVEAQHHAMQAQTQAEKARSADEARIMAEIEAKIHQSQAQVDSEKAAAAEEARILAIGEKLEYAAYAADAEEAKLEAQSLAQAKSAALSAATHQINQQTKLIHSLAEMQEEGDKAAAEAVAAASAADEADVPAQLEVENNPFTRTKESLEQEIEAMEKSKAEAKENIKAWVDAFAATHGGRQPGSQDKKLGSTRALYVAYTKASQDLAHLKKDLVSML